MAGFGGAVKLTGESEYKRALSQITQNLREVTAQMRTVSSAFDKNDHSAAAVAAKTEAYNRQLDQQKQKLTVLKTQYEQMVRQYNENIQKHDQLVSEYEKEKQKLDQIGQELGTSSQEYKNQLGVVSDYAKAVRDSAAANEYNGKQMSEMRIKIANAETDINKTTNAINALGEETEDSGKKAKESAEGYTVFKNVLANLATDAARAGLRAVTNGIKSITGALVSMGKQAVSAYAVYEQMWGGIQTIFGEKSAETVRAYAENAWKSAGVSANDYMNQVTSFSATLIQGLKGDTEKAAYYADMAIKDMADNVNKMGTSMESVQHAYQGFAKDNYTMLDNLKIGYGGNASEMARLINDTGVLGDKVKVTARTVKDVPFDKIVEAIHLVQQNIGITGTTVQEANETISGSALAMRAAWSNLLRGVADDTADFEGLIDNFVGALLANMKNMLPRIQQALQGVSKLIISLTGTLLPQIAKIGAETIAGLVVTLESSLPELTSAMEAISETLISSIVAVLPQMLNVGVSVVLSIVQGIGKSLTKIVGSAGSIIKSMIQTITKNLPQIILVGMDLLVALIEGLNEALPELIDYAPEIISSLITTLTANFPKIAEVAVKIMLTLGDTLINNIPKVVVAIPKIVLAIIDAFISAIPNVIVAGGKLIKGLVEGMAGQFVTVLTKVNSLCKSIAEYFAKLPSQVTQYGRNIVQGLWNGINGGIPSILAKIKSFGQRVLSTIKGVFGIHSPSTVMRDEVGKNLALGLGEGFTDSMKTVSNEMSNAIPTDFNINGSVSSGNGTALDMVAAFKQALSEMKIELDDEVAGRFVEKTVARAVFA